MIENYNGEVDRVSKLLESKQVDKKSVALEVDNNPKSISWSDDLIDELAKGRKSNFNKEAIVQALYRPFSKCWLYFDRRLNNSIYKMPAIYPNFDANNLTICIPGKGGDKGFSALITSLPHDLNLAPGMGGYQGFPLYVYDEVAKAGDGDLLTGLSEGGVRRRDAITDEGLTHFKNSYPGEKISKEDLFYYVYGLLHSQDYRDRYADNLSKELPRIPAVRKAEDFLAFSNAGRDLAELHLNYETVDPYPATIEAAGNKVGLAKVHADDCRVEKMKFAKIKHPETGKSVNDLSTVIYNRRITVTDIPAEAWEYVVNGKPALSWVMERQAVTTHKASGIVNDANDWAIETMGNPKYPLELFLRVITVSLETQKIVNALPKLVF